MKTQTPNEFYRLAGAPGQRFFKSLASSTAEKETSGEFSQTATLATHRLGFYQILIDLQNRSPIPSPAVTLFLTENFHCLPGTPGQRFFKSLASSTAWDETSGEFSQTATLDIIV